MENDNSRKNTNIEQKISTIMRISYFIALCFVTICVFCLYIGNKTLALYTSCTALGISIIGICIIPALIIWITS